MSLLYELKSNMTSGLRIARANVSTDYKLPLSVYLSLTDRCPNNCSYCNYRMLEDTSDGMSTGDILRLVDEMALAGTRRFQLTGGEPMLRNDIDKIIGRAKEKGLFVGVSTSGYKMPQRVGKLKGIDIVFLSLDGDEETHDRLRGKGTYSMVMEAISVLKQEGIRFWTTTVITNQNVRSIDHILGLAKKEGFYSNYVFLLHEDEVTNNIPNVERVKDLMLTDEEIRETASYLLEKKKKGDPVGSTAPYLEFLRDWDEFPAVYSQKSYGKVKCWAGRLSCHINSWGLLYACGPAMGMVEGQDVKKLGLEEAFRRSRRVPSCNSCIHACWLESNLIFSLNVSSIVSWLKALGS